MIPSFWRYERRAGGSRFHVFRRDADGRKIIAGKVNGGSARTFKTSLGAAIAAEKLNDEIPNAERQAMIAAGEKW